MKVIIIGGTAAGMSAAAKIKRDNKATRVIVYEKRDYISFGACGLPYYVGNFFEEKDMMLARTVEQMKSAGIEVLTKHEVIGLDPEKKEVTVKKLATDQIEEESFDKLMIATGASPIVPGNFDLRLKNVYTLHSMEDGIALKETMSNPRLKNVAIIGAGFIGIEVIEAAKAYQKEVFLFQKDDRILNTKFDKEITDLMEEELTLQGVHLYLNSAVTEIIDNNEVKAIVNGSKFLPVDIVVIAIGVRPNTAFLKETGIEMLPNGAIIIDEYGRTTVKDIYSAGDCATVPHQLLNKPAYIPLATSANKLGRLVGENMNGAMTAYQKTLGTSCIKVLDLEVGATGLTEEQAKKLGINYGTTFINDMNQTGYYPGQEKIYVKLVYEKETKVLLGGQVAGKKGAVSRVNVIATAIYSKLTTTELGMLDLCYAPPFAKTWDVLNVAGNVAK